MTVNGFAENFGPMVEAVCLALLAALGAWLCCRGLDRVCRGLKAQLGGVDSLTRVVLFVLCVSLAPFASSKFTGGADAPHVRTSARAPSPTSGEDAPGDSPSRTIGLSFTDIALTPSSAVFGVTWPFDSLTADSLIWILTRTNLVAGAWEPVLCTAPGPDTPPLGIEIPFAELPGAADGTPPKSAFFAAEAQVLADADRDGVPDRDEMGWVEYGAELPAFDFARAAESATLFDSVEDYWNDDPPVVPLPFAVWCGGAPSTNAVPLANGVVGFLTAGREDRGLWESLSNEDFADDHFVYSYDHAVVAVCWDNLDAASGTTIRAATFGVAPERWLAAAGPRTRGR